MNTERTITRSTYDCARFETAEAAFGAVPPINDRELYQVQQFGMGPYWYAIAVHRNGCCGFEPFGYIKAQNP